MRSAHFKLSVVIPCFNEEGNVVPMYNKLKEQLSDFHSYEVIFVDDGSTDLTLDKLKSIAESDEKIKFISFSRNFGHQNALKAGLDNSTGDCVISMDADLQHPPELIGKLVGKWKEGYDVVYTVRVNEENISFLKKFTSKKFYKIVNGLSDTEIKEGAADFRLLDRKVIDVIKALKENYLFIRGIVSWVGFRQTYFEYVPNQRFSGTTKYSLNKMIKFASSGITAFSVKPLKISIFLGSVIAFISFIYGIYAISVALFTDKTIPGWTSVIVSVLFIGGIQLLMIGIIGEYLGKLFMENKRRPNYIIKEKNIDSSL